MLGVTGAISLALDLEPVPLLILALTSLTLLFGSNLLVNPMEQATPALPDMILAVVCRKFPASPI